MKKYIVALFVLLSALMLGCNDSTAENNSKKIIESSDASTDAVFIKAKKPEVSAKQDNVVVKKAVVQSINKTEVEKTAPKALDLSLPLDSHQTLSTDDTLKQNKANYLPNLFKDEESKVDLDGAIIRKHEEESDKYKAADGVGVEIKLSN